jgi:hypothetical protein
VNIDDATYFQTPPPGEWAQEGACFIYQESPIDEWVSVFFPKPGKPPEKALALCNCCVVRRECAEYALEQNQHWGVWGGLTERQRFAVKRQRRLGQVHPLDPRHNAEGPLPK